MATLTGNKIQDTYKDLLQVSNGNSGIDGTLRTVSDGEGTDSPLQISSSAVNINSGLQIGGVAVTSTAAELNALDGVTATATEINQLDGYTICAKENWGNPKGGAILNGTSQYYWGNFTGAVNGVSFWVYPTAASKYILNFGTNMEISLNASSVLTYGSSFANTTTWINGVASTQLTLNAWNYVTCTFDEITATTLEYGKYSTTYFAGRIRDLILFNRALTIADHRLHFNNGLGYFELPYADKGASNIGVLSNSEFTGSATGWTLGTGWAYNSDNVKYTAPNNYKGIAQNKLVVGKRYKITIDVVSNSLVGSGNVFTFNGIVDYGTKAVHAFTSAQLVGTITLDALATGTNCEFISLLPTGGELIIDNFSATQIGCTFELKGENMGTNGATAIVGGVETCLNASGNPISISSLKDARNSVGTTEVVLTDTHAKNRMLKGILVIEKSGSANTFSIGTATATYDIANATAISANSSKFVSVNEFALTTRSLYVKAGASSCSFILIYEEV